MKRKAALKTVRLWLRVRNMAGWTWLGEKGAERHRWAVRVRVGGGLKNVGGGAGGGKGWILSEATSAQYTSAGRGSFHAIDRKGCGLNSSCLLRYCEQLAAPAACHSMVAGWQQLAQAAVWGVQRTESDWALGIVWLLVRQTGPSSSLGRQAKGQVVASLIRRSAVPVRQ